MNVRQSLKRCMYVLTVAACAGVASAQWGQELKPGSDAPRLDVEKWVHGEPITDYQSDSVYLIKFWATWCAPCRAALPKLNLLQREYRDHGLVVVGVSIDDEAETIESFVRRSYGQFAFRVAYNGRGNAKRSYMDAARINAIPVTFIVDRQGKIQYIGNPHDEDLVLIIELVLQGRYDAKLFKDVESTFEAYRQARRVRNYGLAFRHLDEIINHNPHVFAMGHLFKFEIMMVDREDPDQANAYARKIAEEYRNDAGFLATLVQKIVTDPKIKDEHRDLDLAMKIAKQAQETARSAGRGDDPEILHTLAMVHFHQGNVSEAISLQRRAWMIATPLRKPYYERALRSYQEAHQRAARTQRD